MGFTSHAKTVDALLESKHGTTLSSFLNERRTDGFSYERIARDLHDATDGAVSVTWVTIRNWVADLEVVA